MDTIKRDPRKEFGKAVAELAETDERIVVLSADSGGSAGFKDFAEQHPEKYYEFGIMEQGITGIAAGLATTGKIPVFCAIAPFVTCRPYEMFRNDLGYMKQNVKIVGRNAGFTYSDLGATHHSLEDYAIMRMVPGAVVLAPQDVGEIRSAVKAMMDYNGPVYMRIGNGAIPDLKKEAAFIIGKGEILREGNDLTILSTGSITGEVLCAAALLEDEGISVMVIGLPTVSPIDCEIIKYAAEKTGRIMTVEEHYVCGGLGGSVAEVIAQSCPVPLKIHGVPHVYATSGSYEELLRYYKLDAKGIAAVAKDFIA